jgi:hypothetical protein
MKSTHSIRKISSGVIELDNGKKWKPDAFGSSKVMFWSAPFDRVELDDAGPFSKMTNVSRKETIGVSKVS